MSKPKFAPLPMDRDLASDGAWCEVEFAGRVIGRFKLRYCNSNASEFRLLAMRRARRRSDADSRRIARPQTEADLDYAHRQSVELLLEGGYLTDWDLKGADGKAIPFNHENAAAYLCEPDYRFVFRHIDAFASNEANFAEVTADDIMGESEPA